MDVIAKTTYKLRGQAWVVFEKAEDAERAVKLMQGFPFYGKALVSYWFVGEMYLVALNDEITNRFNSLDNARRKWSWQGTSPIHLP